MTPLAKPPFEIQEKHWIDERAPDDQYKGWGVDLIVSAFWYTLNGDKYSIVEVRQYGTIIDVFNFEHHVSARDVFSWIEEDLR